VVFWLFFERKQPMVYFRSSIFKGSNLFHLTERASAIATIIGNALAVSGALGNNKDIETVVGALFTLVNILFVFILLFAYNKDVMKGEVNESASERAKRVRALENDARTNRRCSKFDHSS